MSRFLGCASRRRTFVVAIAACSAGLLAPVASQGAVTIGSNLNSAGNDNHGGHCTASGICTGTNLSLPAANTAAGGLISPINGVAVKWRVKSGSSGNPVALRVLRPAGGTSFTGMGTSTAGTTSTGTAEFNSQVRIGAGDHIGLNIGNSGLVWSSNAGATGVLWGTVNGFPNGLAENTTAAGDSRNSELLVQAVIEPDADADGLGDETQDPCPTEPGPTCTPPDGGGGGGGGGPVDTTNPVITGQQVKPKKFQPAEVVPVRGSGPSVPAGTTIRFNLSEPATVDYRIDRVSKGRLVGGKCKKPNEANNDRPKCKRLKKADQFSEPGTTGANATPYSGRVGKRALKPSKYQVVLSAVDGAANVSDPVTAKFRVVRQQD